MNKLRFILLFAVLLVVGHASAYDFEVDGLYYNILDADAKTVEVTNKNGTERTTVSGYTGELVVPSSVSYGNTNYAVKSIGSYAFYNSSIESLIINEGVESIGPNAFYWCFSLKNISLPSSMNTIGEYAFWNCQIIQNISLPEGVASIGKSAFAACYSLQIVELPSTLTEIGPKAFAGPNSLVLVTSHISQPFSIDQNVFSSDLNNVVTSTAVLSVPSGTLSLYQQAEGWTVFASITEDEANIANVDDINYFYIEGSNTARVIGGNYGNLQDITIPKTISVNSKSYNIKEIQARAFNGCSVLKQITFEEGLEKLGESSFENCTSLQKIVLPSSLTNIGNNAFRGCAQLYSVTSYLQTPLDIDQSVFAISSSTKWSEVDNANVTTYEPNNASLFVPVGTKTSYENVVGWSTFTDINEGEAKEETINGINYLYADGGNNAKVIHGDYSTMTEITIPGSVEIGGTTQIVKRIAPKAFAGYFNLKTIKLEDGVELIGRESFSNCSNLSSIIFPSTLKTVEYNAFAGCWGNYDIILPEGLEYINFGAFQSARSKKVLLPSTLKSIGSAAFSNLGEGVTVISRIKEPFEVTNVFRNSSGSVLFVPIGTTDKYKALSGWNVFSEIAEGEPQEGLGDDGLMYRYFTELKEATLIHADSYSNMQKVSVPASTTIDGNVYKVIGIGVNAFTSTPITSVDIAEGIESIGNKAFYSCGNLTSVSLPESILKIGEASFSGCEKLDTIAIPSKVVSIGTNAFLSSKIKEVVIPATTTSIGKSAFLYCHSLTSIKVESGNLYYDSRNNCNAIIEAASNKLLEACSATVIPNSVTEIGDGAFKAISGIIGITIPQSVTTIGSEAFSECESLNSIYIPNSVSSIGKYAFERCSSLSSINVDPNNSTYDSRNNCNAIIETKSNTLLYGCKSTIIPRSILAIGALAFNGCLDLDSLIIPYGVTSIEDLAFYQCRNLAYIEIPNSIKTIGSQVFDMCQSITSIVSKIKNPQDIISSSSSFNHVSSVTLYVPKGIKEKYEQASSWSKFTNIIEMDGEQLSIPTLSFDGRYVTASTTDKDVDMYYSTDGNAPSIYYDGPITVHNLGTISVMAEKSFCLDSDEASINIEYLYDGDTLKTAKAGLMADAIKWCKNDSIVKMTVVGPINTTEFETIRTLKNLQFLNLTDAKIDGLTIPDNAFANSSIVSFVAPAEIGSVGTGIFSGCQQLAAVSWTTNKSLPNDALSDVSNPNLLLYLNASATAPSNIKNVVKGGKAGTITLSDATGNNNFYCPVAFHADSVVYTHNFQQTTEIGICRGWETIALPFDVDTIYHEKGLTLTPFANYADSDSYSPFWLYTLEKNNITPASSIKANTPYLICMPNNDLYSDEFVLGGNVTFRAANVDMPVSKPIEMLKGKKTFVPTYQRVAASDDIYVLNVNQEYEGYPAGSLFVRNFREARPFEAYTLHPSSASSVAASRIVSVSSLIGGDNEITGIIDVMLKKQNDKTNGDGIVKVYSLSGVLVKQGKANDAINGLPKGIYIANGKKFVVR